MQIDRFLSPNGSRLKQAAGAPHLPAMRLMAAVIMTVIVTVLLLTPAVGYAQDQEPAADGSSPAAEQTMEPGAEQAAEPASEPASEPVAAPASSLEAGPDAAVWYVNGSSGADGNCNTAAAPCRTIQSAIDRAANGDTILVAAGTYTFAGGSSCTAETGTPSVVCVFSKRLVMRGGFASGNFNSYNPAQNPTIIDGQGQNRGVFVLSYSGGGAALDMAGFTVRNGLGVGIGKRPGEDAYFGFGGGMFVENAGSVVLKDMRFESNRAVGSDRGSGPGGTGSGGALSFRTTNSAYLENVVFTGNQARGGSGGERGGGGHGGALYTFGSTVTGSDLTFTDNLAQSGNSSGSGQSGDGERADAFGGAAAFQINSTIRLEGVTARNNRAIGGNAGVYAGGGFGGAFMGEQANISIVGANISGNLAQGGNAQNGWFGNGGGVMAIHSGVSIDRAYIIGNTARGGNGSGGDWGLPNGGGVMVTWTNPSYGSELTVANSIIAANQAVTGQGREIVIGGGGGLWIQATNAVIDHSTIAANVLSGGGLFGAGIQALNTGSKGANVTIRNSLLTDHRSDVGSAVDTLTVSTVTFADGLFYNNTYNTSNDNPIVGGNRGTVNGLGSMGSANPQYVSPGGPDYNYRITAGSPARNKVTNVTRTVDIDNQQRDAQPDFGADEYSAPARPPIAYSGVSSTRTSITIQWDIADDLAGQLARYRLTYSYQPAGGGSRVSNTVDAGKQTSYTLRNLQPLVVYTVTVEALNSSGQVIASGGATTQLTSNVKTFLPRVAR